MPTEPPPLGMWSNDPIHLDMTWSPARIHKGVIAVARGTMRNGSNDLQKFVQWVGRKCRNHNPLAEVSGNRALSRGKVMSLGTIGENTIMYGYGDKMYMIEITEIQTPIMRETFRQREMEEVGY